MWRTNHYIDTSVILDGDTLSVFATNRHLAETAGVHVEVADRIVALNSAEVLTGPEAKAANSFERPEIVKSQPLIGVEIAENKAAVDLPLLSVAAMTFRLR